MKPFNYLRADSVEAALDLAHRAAQAASPRPAGYLAGGTSLLDLMKIGVTSPSTVIDINSLDGDLGSIRIADDAIHLGALVRMSQAADHDALRRACPAIHGALWQAASAQLRNMASLAGNVLQRTRCHYFRDVSWPCNKRSPGSGCSAIDGVNRRLAVLGVSEHCIANYPGDFAVVLAALDAQVDVSNHDGSRRRVPFEALHTLPGDAPDCETTLAPAELITGFSVPRGPWLKRSLYLKVRDRESYDFALASAAVALTLREGRVEQVRIGIGGLAAKPWRSHEAEAALQGAPLDEASAARAAEAAFAAAVVHRETAFKPELGRRTLVRALLQAAALPNEEVA